MRYTTKTIFTKLFLLSIFLISSNIVSAEDDICDIHSLNHARQSFKALYDQKQYDQAYTQLKAYTDNCKNQIPPQTYLWMQNDLAFTAFQTNNPNQCQIILYKMQNEPEYKNASSKLKKSFIHNVTICQKLAQTLAPEAKFKTVENAQNSLPLVLLNGKKLIDAEAMQKVCQCPFCNYRGKSLSNFDAGGGLFFSPICKNGHTITCDFSNADFTNANLKKSNFIPNSCPMDTCSEKESFNKANFYHANLQDDQFTLVDLQGTHFVGAYLKNVSFDSCALSNADFSHATLDSVVSNLSAHAGASEFDHANFSFAHFINVHLAAGDFRSTNFSHADLNNTTFVIDDFSQAHTQEAPSDYFAGANFSYTDLTKVTFQIASQSSNFKPDFNKAILCHTVMPDKTVNNRDCSRSPLKGFVENTFHVARM